MRILIASHWFMKLVVPQQAAALTELGHEVAILTGDHSHEFGGDHEERLRHLAQYGVEVIVMGKQPIPHRSNLRAFPGARRTVRQWSPEVILAHSNHDMFLLGCVRGYPMCLTLHDPEPHPGAANRTHLQLLAHDLWIKQASRLVLHSRQLVGQLPESLRNDPRLAFIPHGVDVVDRPLEPPESPAVLMFGRLEPYKGIDILMSAMRVVWDQRPEVRLIVAGKGPSADEVVDDPRVEFRNRYIPESELPELLARASACVLPYTQASQSGVGLLSLAHGIPTVVTNAGGLPDLAVDPDHMAVSGDHHDLARALLTALDDGARERDTTLEFVRTRFSWPVVATQYEALATAVVEAGR